MAVGVGLDDRPQLGASCRFPQLPGVAAKGAEVDRDLGSPHVRPRLGRAGLRSPGRYAAEDVARIQADRRPVPSANAIAPERPAVEPSEQREIHGSPPRRRASGTILSGRGPARRLEARRSRSCPRTRRAPLRGPRRRPGSPLPQPPRGCGSMPLARKAATIPVSTSPLPAVARPGFPRSATRTPRPGAATSVSTPLRSTTAPVSSAPARDRRRAGARAHRVPTADRAAVPARPRAG